MDIEKNIEFFDVNFWFGENYISKKLTIFEEDAIKILLERKKSKNIISTLVSNFLSFFYSPTIGNDLTNQFLKNEKLQEAGVMGVLFMEQDFFYNPENFEKWLIKSYKNNFKILRLLPSTHKYPFESSLFANFYEILNSYNFPIIISIDELDITGNKNIRWDELTKIADMYENMPIILDGGQSKELMYNSFLLSLLNNTSNIYIETHNLLGLNQIEDLANFKGAERLIFGSYFPFLDDNLALGRIINSNLDFKQKSKIASINIKNIIDNIII